MFAERAPFLVGIGFALGGLAPQTPSRGLRPRTPISWAAFRRLPRLIGWLGLPRRYVALSPGWGLPSGASRLSAADASCQAAVHPFQPSARREGWTRAARSVRLVQVGSSAPGGHLGAHISGPRWVLPASGGALSVIRSWGGVLVQPTTVGNRWAVGRTGPPPVGCYSTGGPRPGSAHAA
jgi:hypothetical protein